MDSPHQYHREETMECAEIKKRLTAWADGELTARQARGVENHLRQCPLCQLSARHEKKIAELLDALPPITAPAGFSYRTRQAFRTALERPNLIQWWQHLSFIMRGVVCGAALAGLLFGAVMGASLSTLNTDSPDTSYHTLYADIGIFP